MQLTAAEFIQRLSSRNDAPPEVMRVYLAHIRTVSYADTGYESWIEALKIVALYGAELVKEPPKPPVATCCGTCKHYDFMPGMAAWNLCKEKIEMNLCWSICPKYESKDTSCESV